MLSLGAFKFYYVAVYIWFVIGALYIAVPSLKALKDMFFGAKNEEEKK